MFTVWMMLRSSLSAVPTPALTSSSSHVLGAGLTLEEKFVGCMILSAAGDAMGFRRCDWEFCHSGLTIHRECAMLSGNKGPLALVLDPSDFPVSDGTEEGFAACDVCSRCAAIQLLLPTHTATCRHNALTMNFI